MTESVAAISTPAVPAAPNILNHRDIQDLLALHTSEDRLMFLTERSSIIPPLPPAERSDHYKVRGCLSGLWVKGEKTREYWVFRTFSDSNVVHGVSSLLCDLLSNLTSTQISAISDKQLNELHLEPLLSLNRRHAVQKVISVIRACAKCDS